MPRPLLSDAAITALVVLVLTTPIVGLRMVGQGGTLGLEPHFGQVAGLAAAAFALRLLVGLIRLARGQRNPTGATGRKLSAVLARNERWLGPACLAAALILPFVAGNRWIDLGTTVLIYVMLGWGLNIVVGLAGLLDLGYVAFYGVGAYTVALLARDFGLGFWPCLPLAGLMAGLFGLLLGFPVLRLRGDYLAIVTLGFGEIVRIVLLNWYSLTNGPNGIGNIPRPTLFGLTFTARPPEGGANFAGFFGLDYAPVQRQIFLYFVILGLALLTNLLTLRLRRLPIGRAWEALREDEIACRALGIDATGVKLSAFALGATFGGLAGAFFATKMGFVSPESFTFSESATILAIVVLGGRGSQLGVVLAAILLVATPELLREFQQYRMMLFGAAMVGVMLVRPHGLLAFRRPSIALGRRREAIL